MQCLRLSTFKDKNRPVAAQCSVAAGTGLLWSTKSEIYTRWAERAMRWLWPILSPCSHLADCVQSESRLERRRRLCSLPSGQSVSRSGAQPASPLLPPCAAGQSFWNKRYGLLTSESMASSSASSAACTAATFDQNSVSWGVSAGVSWVWLAV